MHSGQYTNNGVTGAFIGWNVVLMVAGEKCDGLRRLLEAGAARLLDKLEVEVCLLVWGGD